MNSKMKSFVKGILLGLVSRAEFPQGKEPVAYLYNGVRLPKLPKVEGYPYAVIVCFMGGNYSATISSVAFIPGETISASLWGAENGVQKLYKHSEADNAWSFYMDGKMTAYIENPSLDEQSNAGYVNIGSAGEVLWCNQTIKNADGTVYFAASEPVPVYE